MFYEEKDVNEELVCRVCNEIFSDPRLLPCGESLCNFCIESLKVEGENWITCVCCHKQHTMPVQGSFPPNSALNRLLSKRPKPVYRGTRVETLKEKLNVVKTNRARLNTLLSSSTDEIREHCDLIRNKVHLQTEILVKRVHDFSDSFLKDIDMYEKEYLDHLNSQRSKPGNVQLNSGKVN